MLAAKTIAVVGLSGDPMKPSHYVSANMQAAGKRILHFNPSIQSVLGATGLRVPDSIGTTEIGR
jgi:predicted CoA-binding protein